MGQKSLSLLHRADSSMIWSSYIFDKKNKWLSYNLWFIYIYFYKNIIFHQFYLKKNRKYLHNKLNCFLYLKKKKKLYLNKKKQRFSYYIDLYCFEIYDSLILINLFFFTNLRFYKQELKLESIREEYFPFDENFLESDSKYNYNNNKFFENTYNEFF